MWAFSRRGETLVGFQQQGHSSLALFLSEVLNRQAIRTTIVLITCGDYSLGRQLGRDNDFPDEVLAPQDATIREDSELLAPGVVDYPAPGRFGIIHLLWNFVAPLQFIPMIDVTDGTRQAIAIPFRRAESGTVVHQAIPLENPKDRHMRTTPSGFAHLSCPH